MNIIPFGSNGILINFDQVIDPKVNHRVQQIADLLRIEFKSEIAYLIPAYCSITIKFHPSKTRHQDFVEQILSYDFEESITPPSPLLHIPVCYNSEFGPDLSEVAKIKQLDEQDIINLHTSRKYQVYMMGFLPGFPYLGGLPKTLGISRKETPRKLVPKGSVGLAGMQTGIYPLDSPGGWQILGRTPVDIFQSDSEDPFIIRNGDNIRFYSVSEDKYHEIRNEKVKRDRLYEQL